MITISLNQIREHGPCREGWEKLLKYLGKTKADDEMFPFRVIIDSNGIEDAIWALRCLDDETPERLLAVAWAQEVLHLMRDERSVDAVRVAHLYAHGEVDDAARAAAGAAAWAAAGAAAGAAARAAAWAAARAAAWEAAWEAAGAAAGEAAWAAAGAAARAAAGEAAWAAAGEAAWAAARCVQRDWLIAIVENY